MNNSQTFLSRDLQLIKMDLTRHTVEAIRKVANREFEYFIDLNGHALSSYMCEFLIERGPNMPSGTLVCYCHAFSCLMESCQRFGYQSLNAESFSVYTEWLKRVESRQTLPRFNENTRRGYGNFVLKFMEWLADNSVIGAKEVDTARLRHQKALQGRSARQLERLRLKAVSPEDFTNLIRAIRLEYEECRRLLGLPYHEQDKYDVTFPLLPFSMLLGTELAVRSVEFNHLNVRDLRGDRLLLNPPRSGLINNT